MINSFLKENNIIQVCVSDNIKNNIKFHDYIGYNGKKTSTLFYGIGSKDDLHRILCHKTQKAIFWTNDIININIDIIKLYIDDPKFNNNIIAHICETEVTCNFLDKLSIKYEYFKSESLYDKFMVKYNTYSENNHFDVEEYEKYLNDNTIQDIYKDIFKIAPVIEVKETIEIAPVIEVKETIEIAPVIQVKETIEIEDYSLDEYSSNIIETLEAIEIENTKQSSKKTKKSKKVINI